MEFISIRVLENSGIGDPIHIKIMDAFRKSEGDGIYYCYQRGYHVRLTNTLLSVTSDAPFGLKFIAEIKL